ncbi:MAG: hypothetical protein ACXVW7_13770 [Trebonia sp.]
MGGAADRDGCHDFAMLSPREAQRAQPAREGPRSDELGVFGECERLAAMEVNEALAYLWPRLTELCSAG